MMANLREILLVVIDPQILVNQCTSMDLREEATQGEHFTSDGAFHFRRFGEYGSLQR